MMRRNLLLLSVMVLSVGCGSLDNDEDGLTLAQETELGTDPELADTDGDGVRDDKEVELGTNPTVADTDEDGLNDGDEVTAGTDPTQPDTDVDGFSDSAEIDGDSDPLDYRSYPHEGLKEGQWPNRLAAADGVYGTGWDFGKVMPNIEFLDQYSEAFELYQFYGYVVALDFSAGWCGPCRSLAVGAQALYEEMRDDGFIMIHCLINTNSQGAEADEAFLQSWAEEYSLEFPVAREPVNQKALNFMRASGLYPQTIPFVVLLDQEMKIDTRYGGSSEEAMKERAMELLNGEASDDDSESEGE
jgi:thiol-disulfide isomerase/thioredoxin